MLPPITNGWISYWLGATVAAYGVTVASAKLSELLGTIVCGIKLAACDLAEQMLRWHWNNWIENVMSLIPDPPAGVIGNASAWYTLLNGWMPLTEAIVLFSGVGLFYGSVLIVRNVFRFIPTMS